MAKKLDSRITHRLWFDIIFKCVGGIVLTVLAIIAFFALKLLFLNLYFD